MALTNIQIFKMTPKTNCKECGSSTCMGFAMKVYQGNVDISACPYVSEEALATSTDADKLRADDTKYISGGEMFCPNCKNEIEGNMNFCPFCGKKISEKEVRAEEVFISDSTETREAFQGEDLEISVPFHPNETSAIHSEESPEMLNLYNENKNMVCQNCGNDIEEGMDFCPFCDEKIPAKDDATEEVFVSDSTETREAFQEDLEISISSDPNGNNMIFKEGSVEEPTLCGSGILGSESTGLRIPEKNVLDDKKQMDKEDVIRDRSSHHIHERIEYRDFWQYIILSLVTCGVYGIYILCGYVKDINKICEGDGQESNSFIIVLLLTMITGGIYGIYWWYVQSERLYSAALNYGIKLRENGKSILLWLIPANIIMLGGGTFIANYIMFDNMNMIAKIYNGDMSKEELQKAESPHPDLIKNVWTIYGILLVVGILLIVAAVNSFIRKMEGVGELREDTVYDQNINTEGHDGFSEDMYTQDDPNTEAAISERQTAIPTPDLPNADYTGHYLSMETGDMIELFIDQQGSESSGRYELRIDIADQYDLDGYYSGFFYGEYCKEAGFEGIMHSGPMNLYYYKNGDLIDRITTEDQTGKIYVRNGYLYWDWYDSVSDVPTIYRFQKLKDEYVESETTGVPYDGDYSEAADQYQPQIDFAGKYTDTFSETAEMIIDHNGSDYGIEIREENIDGSYSQYHLSGSYDHYTDMIKYSGYMDIVEILSNGDEDVISTESELHGTIYYRDGYLYLNCDNGNYYETTFRKIDGL